MTGQFDDEHHAEPAHMLLDQIGGLSAQINQVATGAEQLLQSVPGVQPGNQQDGPGTQPPLWSAAVTTRKTILV